MNTKDELKRMRKLADEYGVWFSVIPFGINYKHKLVKVGGRNYKPSGSTFYVVLSSNDRSLSKVKRRFKIRVEVIE